MLPHDGATNDKVFAVSYESVLRKAQFTVRVVPNQGPGAAGQRIEAVRRLFVRVWVNEATCEPGLKVLGAYHEKRHPTLNVGLGPEHDWASHGSDAFGLMAMDYREPTSAAGAGSKMNLPNSGAV